MLKVLTLAMAIGMAATAFGQSHRQPAVPYQPDQGPVTYEKHGKTTTGSDGSRSERIGHTTYGDDGSTRETYGDTTYGDDGSKAEKVGNETFIEDADGNTAHCEKIGDKTFCDKD